MKNLFGLINVFIFSFYYKSLRQVLTPIDNLQRLLRLPIFDKTRLVVAFHLKCDKINYNNCFLPDNENASAHDLDSLRAINNDNQC